MIDYQLIIANHFQISLGIDEMFMYTSLKSDVGQIAKNPALQHGINDFVVIILVDINQAA